MQVQLGCMMVMKMPISRHPMVKYVSPCRGESGGGRNVGEQTVVGDWILVLGSKIHLFAVC